MRGSRDLTAFIRIVDAVIVPIDAVLLRVTAPAIAHALWRPRGVVAHLVVRRVARLLDARKITAAIFPVNRKRISAVAGSLGLLVRAILEAFGATIALTAQIAIIAVSDDLDRFTASIQAIEGGQIIRVASRGREPVLAVIRVIEAGDEASDLVAYLVIVALPLELDDFTTTVEGVDGVRVVGVASGIVAVIVAIVGVIDARDKAPDLFADFIRVTLPVDANDFITAIEGVDGIRIVRIAVGVISSVCAIVWVSIAEDAVSLFDAKVRPLALFVDTDDFIALVVGVDRARIIRVAGGVIIAFTTVRVLDAGHSRGDERVWPTDLSWRAGRERIEKLPAFIDAIHGARIIRVAGGASHSLTALLLLLGKAPWHQPERQQREEGIS